MSSRFFVDSPITGDCVQLAAAERQHLVGALRGQEGDEVTLFDGSGAEFTARVVRIRRTTVDLQVLARHAVDRELEVPITLGVALPKGDRQRWLIEKAVETGVACVVPLITDRGVAQPVPRAIERLERYVIEAAKQCGRNRLMRIDAPVSASDYFRQLPDQATGVLAHPGDSAVPVASLVPLRAKTPWYLAIGPEGGFSDHEVSLARGWQVVSLGRRILRVETAALTLAAYFSLHSGG
jgi:16S rRNA (uracil1498-N3)-methyltransferase